ncbi:Alkaline phosphatase synthesis sensor protein PhoR [Methyloligella halotolerans]|uniref:histidine kinase n=1 Tax=Methyloligella halotolerans TaxID=1177755 RepID=A0A1E2RY60_9HYPH|nr:ATP-binding protein [Methyloligella halotolerans]ODA67038.1 Alkaline phosphatase synthesis sensor protein PhoR [Methyloligella halotolerans]
MQSFYELGARLRAALWLIVAVAAILATLVVETDLPLLYGLAGFLVFLVCAGAAPRNLSLEDEPQTLPGKRSSENAEISLNLVTEAYPDPAVMLDSAGHVLFYNAAAGAIFTSLREGGHVSSVIRNPAFLDALTAAPDRGRSITVSYTERVLPVGRRMAVTVAPLSHQGHRARYILVLLRDLTESERINQMRSDFVANASHELRTPLASLRGFIETLQLSAKDDAGARERFLKVMAEQAARMTRLIDQLLSLSRAEMNVHVAPSNLIDLNHVIDNVRDATEPLAQEHGVKLQLKRFAAPALVRGDLDELVQVLQNLVTNALKYGADKGVVRVEGNYRSAQGRGNGRYSIAVIDEGKGIPSDHLPRLTERFYRVDVAYSRERGGTGLGLAIVKHIVNRHRGELTISSKPGEGSTFTVVFDAVEKPQEKPAPSQAAE